MERDIEEINVIPLVDVMLVLLVIVLTTATFISTGQIPVSLAKAKSAEAVKETPLKVTVQADGSLYLEQQKLNIEQLPEALQGQSRQLPVIVMADRQIVLERFVTVVDAIKSLGFEKISLKVERQ